ncbi:MAG: RelA/SpoT family protein [Candidatus Nomurabacteria bacterium]|nr:RelA/SpoT family protein [Candidatus Nomurabacteria bacterium]
MTSPDINEIFDAVKESRKRPISKRGEATVQNAYDFAKQAHKGQKRKSGEPYFNHVFATALNAARFGMDTDTIVAGFLHDTVEDTDITEQQLEQKFGPEVAFLVQGVTKLGTLKYHGRERHVASLRKFFIASAEDPRVIIIKLADRLHNLQTLGAMSDRPDKQKRIALESIEIHAPLAYRLGIGKLAGEINDLAFPFAYPKEFETTEELLRQKKNLTMKYLEKVYKKIIKEMAKNGITDAKTEYRAKGKWSLYKKLHKKDMDIDKIYDIVALRVMVPNVEDCYRVLGMIHNMWRPLPGRIKDYIALPKPNGYQSLHTTIFTGDGGIAEIQIRTPEMHAQAEYGIASHFSYKHGESKTAPKKAWLKELGQVQKEEEKSDVFMKNLTDDFFVDRIFVLTPEGDVIDLPQGATALDLAYMIHSDIGNHATGAKINGKFGALKAILSNGDIVEIKHDKKKGKPSSKWLDWAKTTMAKKQIQKWLKENGGSGFFNVFS